MKLQESNAKLDARLSVLLRKKEKQLERLKKSEYAQLNALTKGLPELMERVKQEKDSKRRKKLEMEISNRMNAIPNPITFGLHFPKEDVKGYRKVTKIKDPFVSVFVKANANIADLRKLGIEVRNQSGDIFTCFIPLKKVLEIAALPAIECIELARPSRNDLGDAIRYNQVGTLHAAPNNLTGEGVIVGIIDTRLDVYHVDFRNDDGLGGDGLGSSRVLFLWDQSRVPNAAESSPPADPDLPGFSYAGGAPVGIEYSQADINAEFNNFTPAAPNAYSLVRHIPRNAEHGTHVAGCGVGNGRSGFPGAAPGAPIIFVALGGVIDTLAGGYIGADSTFLMDAFAYIFARASQLNMPCVANRSGSDNMGPHDGTTLGEQFLDNLLLTPNRVITVAAGNTNSKTETLLGTVPAGGTTDITINYFSPSDSVPDSNDVFEIWYDGHDRFDISLSIPTTPTPTILNVPVGSTGTVTLGNGIDVTIDSVLHDPRNGDNRITLIIENVSAVNSIINGDWVITLNGVSVINGAFSSWLERNNRDERTLVGATLNNMSIATPATGLRVIAVGSHNDVAPIPVISPSSSCGPTRDGRVKPEITTTGVGIAAANSRNRNALGAGIPNLVYSDSGTSFASPIVAGTCALIYECRGAGLSWYDMKQILQNNVGTPPVGIPSNTFGFGFLQIAGGCAEIVNDVDVWLRDAVDDTGIEPYPGAVTWRSPDIEVLDMLGAPVSNPTHDPANFVNNIIRVTARNRSATQVARNVEVFLYWADPGTAIAFPTDWKSDGLYTGTAPNFVNQSNKIVIPQIPAGGAIAVDFAWAPPAPGSNVRGDNHFCLLARLEHEADESNINAGGWGIIRGSNNIALRNTHIVEAPAGDADSAFYITGTEDTDSLEISTENIQGQIRLILPAEHLTWRELALTHLYGNEPCSRKEVMQQLHTRLKKASIFAITGIAHADAIEVRNGIATITFTPGKGKILRIPHLVIANREKAALRIQLKGLTLLPKAAVHIGQLSGGVRQTGVSIEPVKKLKKSKVKSVVFDGKKLQIQ